MAFLCNSDLLAQDRRVGQGSRMVSLGDVVTSSPSVRHRAYKVLSTSCLTQKFSEAWRHHGRPQSQRGKMGCSKGRHKCGDSGSPGSVLEPQSSYLQREKISCASGRTVLKVLLNSIEKKESLNVCVQLLFSVQTSGCRLIWGVCD